MIIQTQYTYHSTLQASERVRWRVEDILNDEQRLDFAKPFLPESLARTGELGFLSSRERLLLNQIRGNTYLGMFGVVEEFVLPFLLDHVRPLLRQFGLGLSDSGSPAPGCGTGRLHPMPRLE